MKVHVSQGHEKGIGLEVFLKSFLVMDKEDLAFIELIAFKKSVEETLTNLNLPFEVQEKNLVIGTRSLSVTWMEQVIYSESLTCLNNAMELCHKNGVLFTLPTSKDQFEKGFAGHTEYFRHVYKKPELGMFFSSPKLQVLLLSDHVSIKDLPSVLTEELIHIRIKEALQTLKKWQWPINRILISGINPHAGENGLIGDEDARISTAIKRLTKNTKIEMRGPLPGDTMLLEQRSSNDLLIYLFHDQGLGVFKGQQGFIGSNITLGLPYPRFSPDHGTSFNLYGKNSADYRGCEFSLKQAVALLKKVSNGKDSGHQS